MSRSMSKSGIRTYLVLEYCMQASIPKVHAMYVLPQPVAPVIKKIPVFRYIFASGKSVYQLLVQPASGSIVDIHDICFRLVESSVADKKLLAVILAVAVFNIYQHSKTVFKRNFLKYRIVKLVTECICHCGKTHFNKFICCTLICHM